MKLNLRLYCGEDVRKALAKDKAIVKEVEAGSAAFWVDAESEVFDRILERTKATSGLRLTPDCIFAAKEQAQARYFQIISRKTVMASDADNELNLKQLEAQAPVKTAAGTAIKRMERILLSKAPVEANSVAGLDEWAEEYLAGKTAAGLFQEANLQGLELRPVHHPKTKAPLKGVFQLYTANVMPPVVRDASVMEVKSADPEEGSVQVLGALCYALDGKPEPEDFNRTAEPLSSNQLPCWVVSRKVVELVQKHKVKGWAFRPVLEMGTALYADHEAKWEVLRKKLASNPRHHFAV